MRLILRLALTLVLVAIAAFCCFGFLASRELEPANKSDRDIVECRGWEILRRRAVS